MAIDEDINTSPDFNEYSPRQLTELQKSAIGEFGRATTIDAEFILFIIFFMLLIFAMASFYYMLTKN